MESQSEAFESILNSVQDSEAEIIDYLLSNQQKLFEFLQNKKKDLIKTSKQIIIYIKEVAPGVSANLSRGEKKTFDIEDNFPLIISAKPLYKSFQICNLDFDGYLIVDVNEYISLKESPSSNYNSSVKVSTEIILDGNSYAIGSNNIKTFILRDCLELIVDDREIYKLTIYENQIILNNQSYKKIKIGRSKQNNIVLEDLFVSSHHATIHYDNNSWIISDEKSRNSIWRYLHNNQTIRNKTESKTLKIFNPEILYFLGVTFEISRC